MRKLYFIVSIPASAKDGVITGVVANGWGRPATDVEVSALLVALRNKGATRSLLDSLRDGTYPSPVSVFERRAAARADAALLNAFNGQSLFNWNIIEVGESVRKPVRKPLGWRITLTGSVSAFNHDETATILIDPNGDPEDPDNCLFPTRKAARAVCKRAQALRRDYGYRVEPYYA